MSALTPLSLARRGLMLSLAITAAAPAGGFVWQSALGSGSWNVAANWQGGRSLPPGVADDAVFSTTAATPTAAHTVTVPTPVTVQSVSLLRTPLTLDVPAGSSLNVTGDYATTGQTLNLDGSTLNVAGQVVANTMRFNSGRVIGTVDFPSTAVGKLSISNNSTMLGGSFRFNGSGEITGVPPAGSIQSVGANLKANVSIVGRAIATGTPGQLQFPSGLANYGTITLGAAAGVSDSVVSLVIPTGGPSLSNYGVFNLDAGGSGTNTRTIDASFTIFPVGTMSVATGVSATCTRSLSNNGLLTIATGASLNVANFLQAGSNGLLQVDGQFTTPSFYYSSGTVKGTVDLAGTTPAGKRTLALANTTPTADSTFVLHGGGEVGGFGTMTVPKRITVIAKPVAGTPSISLNLYNPYGAFFSNNGTITLTGNGVADSVVAVTTNGTSGRLDNGGTLNLDAGGTGLNLRNINGDVVNTVAGIINVGSGVTTNVTGSINTDGRINIASGSLLTVAQFMQTGANGVTTVDGTLTAAAVNIKNGVLRDLLAAARSTGFTSGPLRSTTGTAARGLGYADDGHAVTLKATFYGDADLDGGVSINDFNALAANFGQAGGRAWTQGDFDYDGGVSINDFNLLAANFGQSATPAAGLDYSGLLAFAAAHDDLAAFEAATGVPEPTAAATVAMAGLLASRRRRLT